MRARATSKVNRQVAVGLYAYLWLMGIHLADGFQPLFLGEHILLTLIHANTNDNAVEQG